MHNRTWTVLAPVLLVLAGSARAQKLESRGVFADKTGAQHSWFVTPTHALNWDSRPYIPVGGTFCSHYLAEGQTEEGWNKDTQTLDLLKSKGVQDLIIDPVVSAVDVPASAWQRLADYLDANGFRYGITFGVGVKTLLTGTVVKPGSYRVKDVGVDVDPTWAASDAESARFVITDKEGSAILRTGVVPVRNGFATASADRTIAAGAIGLLYPRKALTPSRSGFLPDLWSGYDGYRDRLLTTLARVKFGPGLRFFLDPLGHALGLPGETEDLVPDSPAFRLEFQAYLSEKYSGGVDELLGKWGVLDHEAVKDFHQASCLVPLWERSRGVAFMYDSLTNQMVQTDGNGEQSRFWSDLRDCRDRGISYYMNSAADLLKHEVANVPVIYTYTEQHRIFTNPARAGGFDGLGIAAYGRGTTLVNSGADAALSQASAPPRTTWLIVTETLDTSSPTKDHLGYPSEVAMDQDLDMLRSVGAKGFFVWGLQVLPEPKYANFELTRSPEQMGWLKGYADRLQRDGDVAVSEPRTLPYPLGAAGIIHPGLVGPTGVRWAVSMAPGRLLEFGSSYAGYTIVLPDGEAAVIWSLHGPRETHLVVPDPTRIRVTRADDTPIPFKLNAKARTLTLMLDEHPAVIHGGGEEVFPTEAVEDVMKQFQALIAQADAQKIPAEQYRFRLSTAARIYQRAPKAAFMGVAEALNSLGGAIQPYTWIEAERAEPHSFSEVTPDDAASGGACLALNTAIRPPAEGYGAQYSFSVPADDMYTVWVSCTPPGAQTSPFAWAVDTMEPQTSAEAVQVGTPYLGDRLVWMRLGRLRLKRGDHTLTLRVTDQAPGTGRYFLTLDSFIVTRLPFTPEGITKPPLAAVSDKTPFRKPDDSLIPKSNTKKKQ